MINVIVLFTIVVLVGLSKRKRLIQLLIENFERLVAGRLLTRGVVYPFVVLKGG